MIDMISKYGFNPRTREGATACTADADAGYDVSIHAPVRVRQLAAEQCKKTLEFQSTHP